MYLQNIESNLIVLKLDEKFLKKVRLTAKPKSGVYPGRWKKKSADWTGTRIFKWAPVSSFGFPGAFFREQMVGGQVIGAKSRTKGDVETWDR